MGKAVKTVVGVVGMVVGVVTGQWWLVAAGAALTMSGALPSMKVPKPTANAAAEQRLQKQLIPEANRKIILGETAAGADLRYWEVWGADANSYSEVIAAATHTLTEYGKFYLNDAEVVFDGSGNATGTLAGALSRRTVLNGVSGAGLVVGGHSKWTVAAAMTGCSYYVLDFVYSQAKYPQGLSQRYTQVVKGSPVYDPRRDVAYGGTHVITDQSTWQYSPTDSNGKPIGRNNALQMLRYQLGWKIGSKLVDGKGVDPADIDMATFIQAANDCELMGWYSDCILSTGDSHDTNEGILEAAAGGDLLDTGGRFSYYVAVDDTANIAVDLDADDLIGDGLDFQPRDPMSNFFNELGGTYIDPASLYQPAPIPLVYDNAYYVLDNRKVRDTVAFGSVQDVIQAQKLLRIKLNKSRFQGELTASFTYKAMRATNHSIVRYTDPQMGWTNKLFRVISLGISAMGGLDLVLREESASIYAGGTVVTPPAPSIGSAGDPYIEIPMGTVNSVASGVSGSGGTAVDVVQLTYNMAPALVARTELLYKKVGDTAYTTMVIPRDQNAPIIQPLQPTTNYEFKIRHVSVYGIPGPWTTVTRTTNAVTRNSAGQITYADGTLVEALKPAGPNANNTQTNIAAGISGQSLWATYTSMNPSAVVQPGSNMVFDGGLKLRAQSWNVASPWFWGSDPSLGGYVATQTSGQFAQSSRFPVTVGQTYVAQSWCAMSGAYTVPGRLYIAWYNSSDAYVNETTNTVIGNAYQKITNSGAAPAGAAYGRVAFYSGTMSTGAAVFSKVKCEVGSTPTVFSDDATAGALYQNGVNIDALKPGEIGANVTESRTAAGIVGQGDLATTNLATLPFGQNVAANSDFTVSSLGWALFNATNVTTPTSYSVARNQAGWCGYRNTLLMIMGFSAATSGQYVFAACQQGFAAGTSDVARYGLPVKAGDKVGSRALVAGHGVSNVIMRIRYYDSSYALVNEADFPTPSFVNARLGGRSGFNGDPANFYETSNVWTVPSGLNIAYAMLGFYGQLTVNMADPTAYINMTEPMLCRLQPGQTSVPVYNPGPPDRAADQTAGNTAAAIVGQGSMATQNGNNVSITGGAINVNNRFIVATDGTTTIQSGTSGARKVSTNQYDEVYDSSGNLRMKWGIW